MIAAIWTVLLELSPWLLAGTVVAAILHVVLPDGFVEQHLSGRGDVFKAVALGVPLPLCSCGVIPAGLGLRKDGASGGAAMGFIIATPQTGVDSIMVSAGMLGWPFALFKVVAALVTGLIGGTLTNTIGQPTPSEAPQACRLTEATSRSPLAEMWTHGIDILRSIWRWLVFGILVSAAITVWMPDGGLSQIAEWGTIGAALAALAISTPLYVCATASVPIAAALVAGGLPPATALVFLMAGPATNVATIGAVYRGFGARTLAVYLGTVLIGSLSFALLYDAIFGLTGSMGMAGHSHAAGPVAIAAAIALVTLMAWFAFETVRDRMRPAPTGAVIELPVRGMSCGGCVRKLQGALESEPGVEAVAVSLEPGGVTVSGTATVATIRAVIERVGYQVIEE